MHIMISYHLMFSTGHGRSVAVMCALLVALGVVEDWKKAEEFIRQRRPYIRMNSLHREALEEWSLHRLSNPKKYDDIKVYSKFSGRSRSDATQVDKKSH